MEQRCQLLSIELSELRRRLAAEQQHRSQAEDMLRQAQDQLQIQQQLNSRTGEQVSLSTTVCDKVTVESVTVVSIRFMDNR